MKIIINNKVYDSETTPVMLVWDTDHERKQCADNISNMEPKEGVRIYSEFPANSPKEEVERMLDLATEAIDRKISNLKMLLYCRSCDDLGREGGCHNCGREFMDKQLTN